MHILFAELRSPIVLAILLGACSPSPTGAPTERIALDQVPSDAPLPMPSKQPAGAVWNAFGPRALGFGVPGSAALLTLECRTGADGMPLLYYARRDTADPGAEALFALVGAKGIARLPIAAENVPSDGWQWSGELSAADPRLDVFAGPATATLPGAGMLELPASDAPARLIAECRRDVVPALPATPAPTQSLPNLPSNPAVSPADR